MVLYFAYGSNLSVVQMRQRCENDTEQSSRPVAVAYLPSWRWQINQRGYANVIPCRGFDQPPADTGTDIGPGVYGVLYDMTEADERVMDRYEDVDLNHSNLPSTNDVWPIGMRPKEQGNGDYNKWYLDVRIVKRLLPGLDLRASERVLVYVDEPMVIDSQPRTEYIGRINRGLEESVPLGIPQEWVDEVVRKFIPAGK